MATWEEFRQDLEEQRREEWRQHPWYRPKVSRRKKFLQWLYLLAAPIGGIGYGIYILIAHSLWYALLMIGAVLFLFVIVPLLAWLIGKWTGL